MSLREKQEQTAQAFLDGFNSGSIEGMVARRAPGCVHRILPRSFGAPDRDNSTYLEALKTLYPQLHNLAVWDISRGRIDITDTYYAS